MEIVKDQPDARDYLYASAGNTPTPTADLREWMIDIEDQAWTSSCTAQAGTSALELLSSKQIGRSVELSRAFTYYTTRAIAGDVTGDKGASMRDLCKSLETYGCPPEAVFPFNPFALNDKPAQEVYDEAKCLRVGAYARCADIRQTVFDGYPVLIGARIRKGLEMLSGPMSTHLAQLKDYPSTAVTGGHAMVVVGYDDHDASYIVANSWGPQWADGGYFKVDRGQIHADMMDAWTVMDVKHSEYIKPATFDGTTLKLLKVRVDNGVSTTAFTNVSVTFESYGTIKVDDPEVTGNEAVYFAQTAKLHMPVLMFGETRYERVSLTKPAVKSISSSPSP